MPRIYYLTDFILAAKVPPRRCPSHSLLRVLRRRQHPRTHPKKRVQSTDDDPTHWRHSVYGHQKHVDRQRQGVIPAAAWPGCRLLPDWKSTVPYDSVAGNNDNNMGGYSSLLSSWVAKDTASTCSRCWHARVTMAASNINLSSWNCNPRKCYIKTSKYYGKF